MLFFCYTVLYWYQMYLPLMFLLVLSLSQMQKLCYRLRLRSMAGVPLMK